MQTLHGKTGKLIPIQCFIHLYEIYLYIYLLEYNNKSNNNNNNNNNYNNNNNNNMKMNSVIIVIIIITINAIKKILFLDSLLTIGTLQSVD